MTAGCYYDNGSFLSDDEERKPQLKKRQEQIQQREQKQQQQQQQQSHLSEPAQTQKPTLLALSRTASFRLSPSGSRRHVVNHEEAHSPTCSDSSAAIGELLARQIDQQRLSQPPLSRNPSVRYSRRFSPPNVKVQLEVATPASGAVSTTVQVHQCKELQAAAQHQMATNEDSQECCNVTSSL